MRFSLRRITTVSALCIATTAIPVSAYAAPAAPAAKATASSSAASIAGKALNRVGGHGGQCKQFVNDMARQASGGAIALGGGYYSDYRREGGKRVGAGQAVKGDVIQLNAPGRPDSFRSGMHSAIVVANLGHHTYKVVDSNWVGPERVGTHVWNPYTRAAAKGLVVNIWHF